MNLLLFVVFTYAPCVGAKPMAAVSVLRRVFSEALICFVGFGCSLLMLLLNGIELRASARAANHNARRNAYPWEKPFWSASRRSACAFCLAHFSAVPPDANVGARRTSNQCHSACAPRVTEQSRRHRCTWWVCTVGRTTFLCAECCCVWRLKTTRCPAAVL